MQSHVYLSPLWPSLLGFRGGRFEGRTPYGDPGEARLFIVSVCIRLTLLF